MDYLAQCGPLEAPAIEICVHTQDRAQLNDLARNPSTIFSQKFCWVSVRSGLQCPHLSSNGDIIFPNLPRLPGSLRFWCLPNMRTVWKLDCSFTILAEVEKVSLKEYDPISRCSCNFDHCHLFPRCCVSRNSKLPGIRFGWININL